MAGDTPVTVIGNLTADPELKSVGGASVVNFDVASTPRTFDRDANEWKDGETWFVPCSVWREQADNFVDSLRKGTRVIVTGRLKSRSWDQDGQRRSRVELEVDEVGPSLRYAKANVQRNERQGGNGGQRQAPQGGQGGYGGGYGGGYAPQATQAETWGQGGPQQGGQGQFGGAGFGGPQGGQGGGFGGGAYTGGY